MRSAKAHLIRSITASIGIASAITVSGCASKEPTRPNSPATVASPGPILNTPAGVSQTVQVVTGVLPMGSVPYDNMVLPLVSPNGRFLAVQTGVAPTWPMILAEPGAEVPSATRIEVYELDWREGEKDRKAPTLIATLSEPALLGRSCDEAGFLIESPQSDGSRWIGKADWHKADIDWLVKGPEVNAFASLGLGGRLAWSRRATDGSHFQLVVRANGSEWCLPTDDADWLMPTWSGRSNDLFVFQLGGSILNLRFGSALNLVTFRQSLQRLELTSEASDYTVYQAIGGQAAAVDGVLPSRDQLVFFHPGFLRMAVWRPTAAPDKQGTYLNAHSIAALVDQEDFAFISTPEHLIRQNLRNSAERLDLVVGTQVPRQITSATWPYILLSPGEGLVGVMAMRLLPREDSVFSGRNPH